MGLTAARLAVLLSWFLAASSAAQLRGGGEGLRRSRRLLARRLAERGGAHGQERRKAPTESWEPCADEGQAVKRPGRVRFGFAESWVEGVLPSGASCSVGAFGGSDPVPLVRKICECAVVQGGDTAARRERVELGLRWSRCATEGQTCSCASGAVRFGLGQRWVATQGAHSTTACASSSFQGEDPLPGVTKECWCEERDGDSALPRAKVAIVMLSRHPPDLRLWLEYHVGYMGVDHVFMQVEDTPQFNSVFTELPQSIQQRVTVWKADVVPTNIADKRPADDYDTLQRRQVSAMSQAKAASSQMGIGWLIHIDDDELLHTPFHRHVGEILAAMPSGYDQAYIPNVEAVYPSADIQNCFAETVEYNINAYKFASYANGKAAVRVSDAAARPAGPHQWRDSQNNELPSIHLDRQAFGAPLIVVHFESCPFARWEDKYWELGNVDAAKLNTIPFRFYRESIQRMQLCKAASPQRLQVSEMYEMCAEHSLKSFWASWKTEANPSITPRDLMPLKLPWQSIAQLVQ